MFVLSIPGTLFACFGVVLPKNPSLLSNNLVLIDFHLLVFLTFLIPGQTLRLVTVIATFRDIED